MITSFAIVGKNFKTNVYKLIGIDDVFDRWNRGFMVFISVLFGMAVVMHHWLYDVINCLDFQTPPNGYQPEVESMSNFQRFAEEYCWAQGMYTIKEAYDLETSKTPFPGIIPEEMSMCIERELVGGGKIICPKPHEMVPFQRIHLKWYPIVFFYFWIGASLYFFPWRIYKLLGLRDLKDVVLMLQNRPQFADDLPFYVNRAAKWLHNTLSVYIDTRDTLRGKILRHWYLILLVSFKLLYLGISLGLMHYTNKMLITNHDHGASFINYGPQWFSDVTNNTAPRFTPIQNKLFPKMVACEVKRWGVSGIEEWQGMCVLAGNVLYQWLFLFYWLSIVISIFINSVAVLTVLFTEILPNVSYSKFLNSAYVEDTKQLRLIYKNIGSSGRIILRVIGSNVEPYVSEELVKYMIMFMLDREEEDYGREGDVGVGEGEGERGGGGGGGGGGGYGYERVPLSEQKSEMDPERLVNET